MKRSKQKTLLALALMAAVAALLPAALAQELPGQVLAQRADFFPEGIEWDADGERFLLGSLTEGTIFAVDDDGTVTPFIEDEELISSVGIHIDSVNGRLLVAVSNSAAATPAEQVAALGIYDLAGGERLAFVDLGALLPDAEHFANDLTSDPDGDVYVTDSFAGVIYRADADGHAEIFADDARFAVQGFGLNGIDYHPDGFLIAAVSGSGRFFKVPVDDPAATTEIALSQPLGADGILLHPNGDLLVVSGGRLLVLSSDDGWESATVTAGVAAAGATTVTVRDGAAYWINAQLGALFGSGGPVEAFAINRAELDLGAAAVTGDAVAGETLFVSAGCVACHNTGAVTIVGPGMQGVGARAAARVEGMGAAEYIEHSIREPGAFVVEGFQNLMPPTFDDTLTDGQIADLVAYLLTL